MGGWLWFEGSYRDTFIQRIARYDLPMVKHGETERLALRVRSQVGLKTEAIDRWDESLNGV